MKASIWKLPLLMGVFLVSLLIPASASADQLNWSTPVQAGGTNEILTDIDCPSANLCVAVGLSGKIATSTDPKGGAWTTIEPNGEWEGLFTDIYNFVGVDCPSVNLCVVLGNKSNGVPFVTITSTNPTGGAGAWNVNAQMPNAEFADIDCPSVNLCVVVNTAEDILTATNPTGGTAAWSKTNLGAGEGSDILFSGGLSCPSVNLCVIAGREGIIGTTTNPTGGSWTITHADSGGASFYFLNNISCPATNLCVAASRNFVTTSTNPTGGAVAWTVTQLDQQAFTMISCPSVSLCVTVAGEKSAISTNPTGGAAAWNVTDVPGVTLTGVECPATDFCVAITTKGKVFVGTPGPDSPPPPPPGETPGGGNGGSGGGSTPPPLPIPIPKPVECTVPSLKGKSLAKAKKLLTQSHCALGKVKKTNKAKKVVKQSPKSGTLPANSKVAITLG